MLPEEAPGAQERQGAWNFTKWGDRGGFQER